MRASQRRCDISRLQPVVRLPDGRVRVDAHLTRAGIFEYRNPDGSVRREYRPPEEVFKPESMQSFAVVPFTDDHPPDMITSENALKYTRGSTGDTVLRDDDHLRAVIGVFHDGTIRKMEAGKLDVSCGYTCDLDETPGVHPVWGPYDAIQRNIVGNHVALVDKGRAGSATLRMDGAAVMLRRDGEWDEGLHPRAEDGKFASGEGGGPSAKAAASLKDPQFVSRHQERLTAASDEVRSKFPHEKQGSDEAHNASMAALHAEAERIHRETEAAGGDERLQQAARQGGFEARAEKLGSDAAHQHVMTQIAAERAAMEGEHAARSAGLVPQVPVEARKGLDEVTASASKVNEAAAAMHASLDEDHKAASDAAWQLHHLMGEDSHDVISELPGAYDTVADHLTGNESGLDDGREPYSNGESKYSHLSAPDDEDEDASEDDDDVDVTPDVDMDFDDKGKPLAWDEYERDPWYPPDPESLESEHDLSVLSVDEDSGKVAPFKADPDDSDEDAAEAKADYAAAAKEYTRLVNESKKEHETAEKVAKAEYEKAAAKYVADVKAAKEAKAAERAAAKDAKEKARAEAVRGAADKLHGHLEALHAKQLTAIETAKALDKAHSKLRDKATEAADRSEEEIHQAVAAHPLFAKGEYDPEDGSFNDQIDDKTIAMFEHASAAHARDLANATEHIENVSANINGDTIEALQHAAKETAKALKVTAKLSGRAPAAPRAKRAKKDAEWDESLHPRASDGRFGGGSESGAASIRPSGGRPANSHSHDDPDSGASSIRPTRPSAEPHVSDRPSGAASIRQPEAEHVTRASEAAFSSSKDADHASDRALETGRSRDAKAAQDAHRAAAAAHGRMAAEFSARGNHEKAATHRNYEKTHKETVAAGGIPEDRYPHRDGTSLASRRSRGTIDAMATARRDAGRPANPDPNDLACRNAENPNREDAPVDPDDVDDEDDDELEETVDSSDMYDDDGNLTEVAQRRVGAASFAVPERNRLPIYDRQTCKDSMRKFGTHEFDSADQRHAAFNRIASKADQFGVGTTKFRRLHAATLDRKDEDMIDAQVRIEAAKSKKRREQRDQARQRADAAEKKLQAANGEIESLKRDLEAERAKTGARTDSAQVEFETKVADKANLVIEATQILGVGKVDAKMSDGAIKRAVIKHVDKTDVADDKHPAYVDALYDGAVKRATKDSAAVQAGAAAIAQARAAAGNAPLPAATVDPTVRADADDDDEMAAARKMRERSAGLAYGRNTNGMTRADALGGK